MSSCFSKVSKAKHGGNISTLVSKDISCFVGDQNTYGKINKYLGRDNKFSFYLTSFTVLLRKNSLRTVQVS